MRRFIYALCALLLTVGTVNAQEIISLSGAPLPDGETVSTIPNRSVVKGDDGSYTVTYTFDYAAILSDPLFSSDTMISIDGFSANTTPGQPAWLQRTDRFKVPEGATPSLSIVEASYITRPYRMSRARQPLEEQ